MNKIKNKINEIGKELGLPQVAINHVLYSKPSKYKKGRGLTCKDLKTYRWADILWVDVFVNKGDGFKLRISEPAVIVRSDDGDYICMSVHDNACDDICIHTTDYEDGNALFYDKEDRASARYKFYETITDTKEKEIPKVVITEPCTKTKKHKLVADETGTYFWCYLCARELNKDGTEKARGN